MSGLNPVILLEGCDGTGKTTVAKYLQEEHGYLYKHEGPPPPDAGNRLQFYGHKLWKAMNGRRPVVYDRFHLGELVYGPIARNSDPLGYYGMRMFRRIFKSQLVTCVICTASWEIVRANWKKKFAEGDDYLCDAGKLWDCYCRYQGLTAYHPQYAFDQERFPDWMTSYLNIAYWGRNNYYGRAGEINNWHCPSGVIGDPKAKFLVVGEQVNSDMDFPFFADNNSSRFLNEALWEAGYHEKELMFTNAFDVYGRPRDLKKIVAGLPNLKAAITFGNKARVALAKTINVAFYPMPHPAYHKRFHGKETAEYVECLKEIRSEFE